jgi:2-haloacid dehalogenase
MHKRMAGMLVRRIDRATARPIMAGMKRRQFLQALPGATLTLAAERPDAGTSAPLSRPPIRAILFDLFTLFNPRSILNVAQRFVPGKAAELCETWRVRQFEYAWLRVAGGRYVDFQKVTEEALIWAAKTHGVSLTVEARRAMIDGYSQLDLWPDAREALLAWKAEGLRLAPLANYAPSMIEGLVRHAGLEGVFDHLISTDRARTFKPDPRSYALGLSVLGHRREEIAFAAFGGWDAAGAAWFGYPTFWVNRFGLVQEELGIAPDATDRTLAGLRAFVRDRRQP